MLQFDTLRPATVQEACAMLAQHPADSKIIAGGTDLMVQIRDKDKRLANINYLIDCSALKELCFITQTENEVHIGAMTTHTQLSQSPIIHEHACFLSVAASTVGSPQIRNMGTIGGSICNASPAADPLTPLIALDATAKIVGNGERTALVKDIYIKAGVLDLKPGEMIVEFIFKKLGAQTAFEKLGRRKALAISRLNVSAALLTDATDATNKNGKITQARIVPGCVFATPDRVESAEALLIGKLPSQELFMQAGKEVSAEMIRRTGIRWSTEYKQPAIEAMVQRALLNALGMNVVDINSEVK